MWRKFTMPVTQLTHARHQNIYQMCGTTWNANGSDRRRVTCFTQNSKPQADEQTDGEEHHQTITWNMCGVLQFIRKNGWGSSSTGQQQQHRAAHLKRSTCQWTTVHSSHHRICNRNREAGEHNNTLSEVKRKKKKVQHWQVAGSQTKELQCVA